MYKFSIKFIFQYEHTKYYFLQERENFFILVVTPPYKLYGSLLVRENFINLLRVGVGVGVGVHILQTIERQHEWGGGAELRVC